MNSNINVFSFIGLSLFAVILASCKNSYKKAETGITVETPYTFKTAKAEKLSIEAFDLKKKGDYKKAISHYREAISIEPKNPIIYFELAECFFQMEQLTSAIRELNTAILLDSSFAPFFNNRGLIYYRLGDEETACENYLKAIQLDSTHFLYYANLSLAYYEMRKLNEACKAINISKRLGLKLEGQADFLKVERACHLEPTFPQDSVYRLGK